MGLYTISKGIDALDVEAIVKFGNPRTLKGKAIKEEVKQLTQMDEVEATLLKECDSNKKRVIYSQAPEYKFGFKDDFETRMVQVYQMAVIVAIKEGITSIAFPLLDLGNYSQEVAISIVKNAILDCLDNNNAELGIEVYLALGDSKTVKNEDDIISEIDSYRNELARILAKDRQDEDNANFAPFDDIFSDDDGSKPGVMALIDVTGLNDRIGKTKFKSFYNTLYGFIVDYERDNYPDKSGISSQQLSKYRYEETRPEKSTILNYAIWLKLSLDQTKELLKSAKFVLSENDKYDLVLAYYIGKRNYNIEEINGTLSDLGYKQGRGKSTLLKEKKVVVRKNKFSTEMNKAITQNYMKAASPTPAQKYAVSTSGGAESFYELLSKLMKDKGKTFKEANKLFTTPQEHQKLKNGKQPSRISVINYAIYLKLTLDEALELLATAGYTLYEGDLFDFILIHCFEEGEYDPDDINDFIFEKGLSEGGYLLYRLKANPSDM